jgi:hypothetical protein
MALSQYWTQQRNFILTLLADIVADAKANGFKVIILVDIKVRQHPSWIYVGGWR